MNTLEASRIPTQGATRCALARGRVPFARAALASCTLCAHACGVNRLRGPAGLCHAGGHARIFSAQVEVSDELELVPTFALAFSGCDLRCDFCITGAPSWNPRLGELFDAARLSSRIQRALEEGARSVMFLGGEPTVHLPDVLELVAELPGSAKLVWKTNAHGSAQSREWLENVFDVWLADYKFGNDTCAERLAHVRNYNSVVRENLLWAASHSDLIIRHLLMPGHLDCCWRSVAEWIACHLPSIRVNLRSGFWPAWKAARHAELRGTVGRVEAERASDIARELNLRLIE
ncbi:MAG TPA: radical SAM protein [Verrucomicrobiae bacterium]|nr:radical SAM protein [Verrucomicrobiae bacterium]